MRRKIAAGNWKMNTNLEYGLDFMQEINKSSFPEDVEVIIAVPFVSIASLTKVSGQVKIAAQNCHQEASGAFTGEVSANMLNGIGATYVILGHSERRAYFGEDDSLILLKMRAAFAEGLKVIYCCGEPLEIRGSGEHEKYVAAQLAESISKLTADEIKNVTIAYEPIWAIGTGKTASSQQAQDMHASIRSLVAETFGKEASEEISILYGGSVKPANAKEIFAEKDVDGGLVGGASLKADMFVEIIRSF